MARGIAFLLERPPYLLLQVPLSGEKGCLFLFICFRVSLPSDCLFSESVHLATPFLHPNSQFLDLRPQQQYLLAVLPNFLLFLSHNRIKMLNLDFHFLGQLLNVHLFVLADLGQLLLLLLVELLEALVLLPQLAYLRVEF